MTAKRFKRWISLPIGIVIFIVGAILFPLPIPLGLIFMIIGVAIAANNPLFMRFVKRTRKRYPDANLKIRRITPHLPSFLRRILLRTDSKAP